MKIPRWNGGPAAGGDFLTKAGAHVLADRIRDAWRKCGHNIEVTVGPVGKALDEKNQVFGVRMPGLVNGLPR